MSEKKHATLSEKYPFPESTSQSSSRWRAVKHDPEAMTADMRCLYDVVEGFVNDGVIYTRILHDKITSTLGGYFAFPDDPEIGKVEGGIRGMEIYNATQAVYHHQFMVRNQTRAKHLRVGVELKNITIDDTKYSKAMVEEITETGYVWLRLTKRGSANRWRAKVPASILPEQSAEAKPSANEHPLKSDSDSLPLF